MNQNNHIAGINEVNGDGKDKIIVFSKNSSDNISIAKPIGIEFQVTEFSNYGISITELLSNHHDSDSDSEDSVISSGSDDTAYEFVRGNINDAFKIAINSGFPPYVVYGNLAELLTAPIEDTIDIQIEDDYIDYPSPQLFETLTKQE